MLYLDEFQTYVDLPTDLGDVLAQARSLGVGMTLAHQHLGQLSRPELKAAVLANARSRVVFQTGATDAKTLATTLGGGLTGDDLAVLGRYEAYARLAHDNTVGSPGSLDTLPLPPSTNDGKEVVELSRQRYGQPAADIDAAIIGRREAGSAPKTGGRRRRSPS